MADINLFKLGDKIYSNISEVTKIKSGDIISIDDTRYTIDSIESLSHYNYGIRLARYDLAPWVEDKLVDDSIVKVSYSTRSGSSSLIDMSEVS